MITNYNSGPYAYVQVLDAQGNLQTASSHVTLPSSMGGGFGFPGVTVPAYGNVLLVVVAPNSAAIIGTAEMWH